MRRILLLVMIGALALMGAKKKKGPAVVSPLDQYVADAHAHEQSAPESSPGSLWSSRARYLDLGLDLRASRVDDMVTIVIQERADATATGTVKASRNSKAKASITAAGGITRATGPWPNLVGTGSESSLDGNGATTRQTTLSTSLSARVVDVLPNGYLVVEGTKSVTVNSEVQLVKVRGVLRPFDLAYGNVARSESLAQMEVQINGKGVVGDNIRRPNFLYRILLGILPF